MILSEHHLTQQHYFRIKNTELNEIYFVMSIRSFILAMLAIYIPIFLYTHGYSLQKVFLFYLLMFSGEALLQYFSALFMTKVGPKHLIAYSLPFLIFHSWQLWTLQQYNWPLWSIALTASITLALYWQGYHYDFSLAKSKKRANSQVSRLFVLIAFLSAIAPFLGGFLVENFGFQALFFVVVIGLVLAMIPLLKTRDKHPGHKFNLRRIKFDRKLKKEMISLGAFAVEASTHMIIWPLFVFLILGNYEKIGAVTSAALILTVVTTYFIGKNGDKKDKCRYMRVGSILTGIMHLLQPIAASIYYIFGLNLLASFSHSIFTTPMYAEYYLHADEYSRAEYIYLGEVSGSIMRILYFGIIYLLSSFFAEKSVLVVALILGGLVTFLIGLMPNALCELKYLDKTIKVIPKLQKTR